MKKQTKGAGEIETKPRQPLINGKHRTQMPEYWVWDNMRQRCLNPNNPSYKDYGARGITVCAEWALTFDHFIKDMGERPGKDLTLDRIDNDGNYEPGNCRWATRREQVLNRRKNELTGIRKKGRKWYVRIKAENEEIYLGGYADLDVAIQVRKGAELRYQNV